MPVTLTIEDGTGVANANSYGTLAGARAYALNRGITLSATDDVVAIQLITATDYLESFADRYVGKAVSFTQALSWPRKCIMFNPDTLWPVNQIPPQLINAQYQLCIEQFNGINLQPTVDHSGGGYVIRDKVDVLETQYSEHIGTTSEPLMPRVDALLKSLLNFVPALRTVRI